MIEAFKKNIDIQLLSATIAISIMGLITMYPAYTNDSAYELFIQQCIWVLLALSICVLVAYKFNTRMLHSSAVAYGIYIGSLILLLIALVFGPTINGTNAWIVVGSFAVQPSELVKIALIFVLAHYLWRRHIIIYSLRVVATTIVFAIIPFLIIVLQRDIGSALMIPCIWFGMMVFGGLSRIHLFIIVIASLVIIGVGGWATWDILPTYQKDRIISFLQPHRDLLGAGYNAYQSKVAIGSGGIIGKGVGQGTQSELSFLPEFQSDFIFAAFTEEWGLVGVILLLLLYITIIDRILLVAKKAQTECEIFIAVGAVIFISIQAFIHMGVNVGILPVTGITLPFMSYGGSHLLVEYFLIGVIMSIQSVSRKKALEVPHKEFVGYGDVLYK